MRRWSAVIVAMVAFSGECHEVRPGYLEIVATSALSYHVTWKRPVRFDYRLPLEVEFPLQCASQSESFVRTVQRNSVIERFTLLCSQTLEGQQVGINGLSATMTDVLLRFRTDSYEFTALLRPAQTHATLSSETHSPFWGYFTIGVEHLITGPDHVLFIVTLLFLVARLRKLIAVITSFTVAHSITLGVQALGLAVVPQAPVEAMIALSIVLVAAEVLRGDTSTITHRYTWIVAFAFGLLHGLGFAGALSQIGLPHDQALVTLLFFNLGIEVGQLAIVFVSLAAAWALSNVRVTIPSWVTRLPLYGAGGIAGYWFVSRTVSILW